MWFRATPWPHSDCNLVMASKPYRYTCVYPDGKKTPKNWQKSTATLVLHDGYFHVEPKRNDFTFHFAIPIFWFSSVPSRGVSVTFLTALVVDALEETEGRIDFVYSTYDASSTSFLLSSHTFPLISHGIGDVLVWSRCELWLDSAPLDTLYSLSFSAPATANIFTSLHLSVACFCGNSTPELTALVELGFRCCFSCSLHGRCFVRHILWLKVLLQVSHL